MSLTPGTRLGPYEIVSPIGAGGMGEVYRARDTNLDRAVAIKVLPESFALDADRVARFAREAKTLAALNHPNIAAIYGLEKTPDLTALVMELVEGEDLSAHIARGAVSLAEALPIARQIIDALEAAHDAGIVHRDLKPANIKVRDDGMVKVLDFGLAKAMDPAGASNVDAMNSPTLTARSTQLGMILGTAAYMAPEQAKGKAVDKRADIWAFGVVLFEMLTGERAFKGDDVSDTLVSVLRDTPDFGALPQNTPPRLRRLLERCLDRDIKMRLRDIGEARVEIVKIESGAPDTSMMSAASGIGAGPSRQTSWWVPRVILLALAVAALAAVTTWMLKPAPVAPRAVVAQFAVSLPANVPFTRTQSHVIAISPDGSHIAYIAGAQLFVRGLGDLEPTVVAGVRDPIEVFFSPDGQWLGFYSSGRIWRVPVTGGAALVVCESQTPRGASWTGDEILFALGADIMRVAATGGTPEVLLKADADTVRVANPVRLPGQGGVLFGRLKAGNWDDAEIVVATPATGAERILVRGGSDARLLPTGHLMFGRGSDLLAVPFDPISIATMGEPVTLTRDAFRTGGIAGNSARQYSVSDTGVLVYVSGGAEEQTDLVWMDRMGRPEPIITESQMVYARISPDGRRIAYTASGGGNVDIFVLEWARKARSRLTFDPAADSSPIWTPDGKRLVYSSARDGASNLYWQAADGTGAAERLTTNKNPQFPYAIARDGQTMLYIEQSAKTDYDIYAVSLTGDRKPRALLVTAFDERRPALSPDGKWMAYQSNESGSFEIFVRPFPDVEGGRWQVSAGGGASPVWGKTGGEIYYRLGPSLMRVSVSTTPAFSVAAPTVMLKHNLAPDAGGMQYDLAPDGKRFVMNEVHAGQNQISQYNVVLNWFEDVRARVPRKR